jgi:uncharacterized protein (DUF1501 family)
MGASLAVVSAVSTVPGFLDRPLLAAAEGQNPWGAGVPEDRVLVVVQLSGGNDGLNTVVPYGLGSDYYDARPKIGIKQADTLTLDAGMGVGLNREMQGMKDLYDQGMLSVIQAVGYPNPNRSHFSSMDIWHTADPSQPSGYGWLGQTMDVVRQNNQGRLVTPYCVSIGSQAPLATIGKNAKAVSFENVSLFQWSGSQLHPALAAEYERLNRQEPGMMSDEQAARDPVAYIARTSLDAQLASDKIRAAVARPTATPFPPGSLNNQLKLVSAMIRSDLKTRVYYVNLGGFDTHASQLGTHNRQLRELSVALQSFYRELKATGQQDRVLTMVFSEFGRRVAENASQGTDHGTAGPMFLVGPMVRAGVVGAHPSLKKPDLQSGDIVHHTDFRSVYATVLDNWLKVESAKALGARFKTLDVLKA